MKKIALFIALALTGAACRQTSEKKTGIAVRDTTITVENSFTELFIDTTALTSYVSARSLDDSLTAKLRSFYNHRNYQYAWFFPDGVAEFVPFFKVYGMTTSIIPATARCTILRSTRLSIRFRS
jgi:hypothetical protein